MSARRSHACCVPASSQVEHRHFEGDDWTTAVMPFLPNASEAEVKPAMEKLAKKVCSEGSQC